MTTPDSTPLRNEVEQPVPQEVRELGKTVANKTRYAEHHIEQRDQQVPFTPSQRQEIRHKVEIGISALILAAMERFAASANVDLMDTKNAIIHQRDQLRRELEDEKKLGTKWLMRAHDAEQQLAALQRENEELKSAHPIPPREERSMNISGVSDSAIDNPCGDDFK